MFYHVLGIDDKCHLDTDCDGMKAPAVCEGTPKSCRLLCLNSMYCPEGVCSTVTRVSRESIKICMPECGPEVEDVCASSNVCVGMTFRIVHTFTCTSNEILNVIGLSKSFIYFFSRPHVGF